MLNNVHILSNDEYNELISKIHDLEGDCMWLSHKWEMAEERFNALYEEHNREAYEQLDAAHHEELLQWCKDVSESYKNQEEFAEMNSYVFKEPTKYDDGFYEPSCRDDGYAYESANLTNNLPVANYSIVRYPVPDEYPQCEVSDAFDAVLMFYHILMKLEVYMSGAHDDYQRNTYARKAHRIFNNMCTSVKHYNQTSPIEIAIPVSRRELKSLTYYDNMQALKENRKEYDKELYAWCSKMAKKYNRRSR